MCMRVCNYYGTWGIRINFDYCIGIYNGSSRARSIRRCRKGTRVRTVKTTLSYKRGHYNYNLMGVRLVRVLSNADPSGPHHFLEGGGDVVHPGHPRKGVRAAPHGYYKLLAVDSG